MKLHNTKLFFSFFILFAFISVGIFGLLQLSHMSETPMTNCPYAENGFSVCDNNFDHINDWRQFSNIIFPSLFIFSFLILGIILYFFNKQNFLNQEQYFFKYRYYLDNKKLHTFSDKITRWLSLFENSPSLS
ncbi:hypothetical protein A3B84_01555 [Candidatus Nomurabacteria bacterium RIFCSPHIGHO2_02_FULL_35_13]|uniref:Uncharacterized protein n=2 Tax=Candidatus Nomuraibacteriota TaxID=1752729 RepID=A0A1F6VNI3_9BACT|nr:MAG: hypothetical protein UR88_C0001G0015 [Candidatus Nomurabacteria bacterium GW2011_GWA1_35_8]OGI71198.1 MAG: hypothetical protein A3B84_01555 [Candidatus Nomurabacteria bacterium RIFCSPHIGHO2_02_FULL_35_13]